MGQLALHYHLPASRGRGCCREIEKSGGKRKGGREQEENDEEVEDLAMVAGFLEPTTA